MKKKIVLIVLGLFIVISLLLSLSYALWSTNYKQTENNMVSTGCFETTLSSDNDISLVNAVPISDDEGLKLKPVVLTLTNTCSIDSKYTLSLESINTSSLDIANIKVSVDGSYYALSSLEAKDKTLDNATESRILTTGYLQAGKSTNFKVRIWVDENTTEEVGELKTYHGKLVVDTTASRTTYADASGAATPELYQGLIPVVYDESGNTVVGDVTNEWFNYDKHEWANAVLVNCEDASIKSKYFNDDMTIKTSVVGSIIPMDDILQMYVWIPRYRYLLWNAENGSSDPQMIEIKFEDKTVAKSNGSKNGQWLTHPAFTFGDTELNGIWIGKFENSTSDPSCQGANQTEAICNKSTLPITIKPNQSSWVYASISNNFIAIQNISITNSVTFGLTSSEVDIHMTKNMEWGAVAYLSSSIYGRYNDSSTCIASGCEVWINNVRNNSSNSATTTGCSGLTISAEAVTSTTCPLGYDWKSKGVNASTTGNQYGIYDMSGGSWEPVMGNMVDISGNFYSQSSGFSVAPDTKYYDSYAYGINDTDHARGHLGDATKETLKIFGNVRGGWYDDQTYFTENTKYWLYRGGGYHYKFDSGIFNFSPGTGLAYSYYVSSRSVLTAQ